MASAVRAKSTAAAATAKASAGSVPVAVAVEESSDDSSHGSSWMHELHSSQESIKFPIRKSPEVNNSVLCVDPMLSLIKDLEQIESDALEVTSLKSAQEAFLDAITKRFNNRCGHYSQFCVENNIKHLFALVSITSDQNEFLLGIRTLIQTIKIELKTHKKGGLRFNDNICFIERLRDEKCPLSLQTKRHKERIQAMLYEHQPWRIRERMKTASVALVLCLNIGVDPPDVVKIQPCSRLECWIDPSSVSPPKAMELIGSNLQMQYERWQPRARYKKCHDPTMEDVKKLCTSLRRNAKGERILFHYNGHGVPKPTVNGEIWVFNKTFTQYIPLSIFELITWMSAPSIYVYDCSNAGIIINSFQPYAEQHEHELEKALAAAQQRGGVQQLAGGSSGSLNVAGNQVQLPNQLVSYKNCIHLAACAANEILPMNAQLPADLFTSCLTTPINIALKWYAMQEKLGMVPRIQSELIDKIPGKVNDRRTMMGELNWIFTAITDTIAWNTLPRELFQRLFRQDLLVASLFRNFLLAERILRSHDCTPVSLPALPPCYRHPMWKAWDLVVDLALQQLPEILDHNAPYRQLPFFEHQLTAFQVWLDSESESRTPPEQLPIVLQVLLSQVHRLRALELLARFLDLGPWAVNLALGVGIFPYVLKLLQSSTRELRPVLVFIWAKILAVDPTCQVDLVKEYKYFLSVLQDTSVSKEHRTLSAFVLSSIVHNFLLGQTSALQGPLLSICLEQLNDGSWLLRQWLAICLGMLWQNFEKARWSGARDLAHEKLYVLLRDSIPEVRAAAVFALGTFISSVTDRSEEQANNIDRIIAITMLETVGEDMSPLVRMELAAALQWMVLLFESQFVAVYLSDHMRGHGSFVMTGDPRDLTSSTHSLERHVTIRRGASSSSISNMAGASTISVASSSTITLGRSKSGSSSSGGRGTAGAAGGTNSIPFQSIFTKLWLGICNLAQDPFPRVAAIAQEIVDHVRNTALCPIMAAKEATTATSSDKCSSLSVSLPPSPNTRVNYLGGGGGPGGAGAAGESPPVGAAASGASHWATKLRLSGSASTTTAVTSGDPQTILQRKLRTSSINDETDSGPAYPRGAGVAGSGLGLPSGPRESTHSARSSGSESNQYLEPGHSLTPIVTTEFIPWAISYFTRPGKERYSNAEGVAEEGRQRFPVDRNSAELRRRKARFIRNNLVRRNAHRQHQQSDRFGYDVCVWNRKTQFTPSIVKLLPYEPQIAVAYRDKVLVYDFQYQSVRTYSAEALATEASSSAGSTIGSSSGYGSVSGSSLSLNGSISRKSAGGGSVSQSAAQFARVSSIEFINAHDMALNLVAYEDGVVRVWESSPPASSASTEDSPNQARMLTAWTALGQVVNQTGHRFRSNFEKYAEVSGNSLGGSGSGSIVTAWQQCSQHLIIGGGGCRFIRIWDVERELKLADIPLGRSETYARVLAPYLPNMRSDVIIAGCDDGTVQLFDKRCSPQDARISVYRRHSAPILHTSQRANESVLVSGCTEGRISVLDVRACPHSHWFAEKVLHEWDAGSDVTAIASHQIADTVACGNASKVGIYSLDGRVQKVLRTNEGFIGPKIGHPTWLSFHPFKVQLAVGFVDNTVAIYSPTPVL
ncbi:LOW QUALITY PROTEIN: regulatory-associated protein of mTOR [Drosophila ficusphila]|uniref:LOW QUALITY PROTEIN: regulatory-associated protein of mTOR n=1 Tax=Drosophila ficusphila TaxID=30025 RepID=UPI0007E8B166|nr:LOW QUALITY PROTEIN: regulatory-associated protein of mTOR [Drosophila ficusphila]